MTIASNTPLPLLLLAVTATLALTGCAVSLDFDDDATRRIEQRTVAADGLAEVEVSTGNGAVEIVAGAGGEVEIQAVLLESDEGDADYTIRTEDDRLVVRGDCESGWFDRCQVGFTITLPESLDVVVATSNGRIDVDGIAGHLDIETANGAIDGDHLASALVTARTDNGRVRLVFDTAPDDVDVATANGAVVIVVPDEVFDVAASSDNGAIEIDVRTDLAADRYIVADTDNGAIEIDVRAG